jgi:hypothetical protein
VGVGLWTIAACAADDGGDGEVAAGGSPAQPDAAPPSEAPPPSPGTPTWHTDVQPVVDAHCTTCHRDGGSAPFALTDYAAVSARARQIAEVTAARTMPPYPAAPAVRPYRFDISLPSSHIDMLARWADAGAPEGDPTRKGAPLSVDFGLLEDPNLTLQMPEPFTPSEFPDQYRCFVLPWDRAETTYITGFNLRPEHPEMVHHGVLFIIEEGEAAVIDEANGADGAPGYPCYGGASPLGRPSIPTRQVGGWAPGSQGISYTQGTGIVVDGQARVVLQIHYNTLGVAEISADQSLVEFRLESSVDTDGGFLPWLDFDWPSVDGSMLIPAGEASVVHAYEADPTQSALAGLFIPGIDISRGLRIHTVYPHMHQLGRRIEASVLRADGEVVPLARIDDWDFHWQREYPFVEPVDVLPGDHLRVECDFDNSPANQAIVNGEQLEPRDMDFGEGSYDEMCVAAFYVTALFESEPTACDAFDARPAPAGRLELRFDAAATVRDAPTLDGELRGIVRGSVYRAADVTITGPKDGTSPVASFTFDGVDVREGPSAAFPLDTELPAGDYQVLGFMDIDANADANDAGPDAGDPVFIPVRPITLECDVQPVTVTFALLLPEGR